MQGYLQLLRPTNWVKNLLIALPLILSNHFSVDAFSNLAMGFLSFSLLASAGYILNDLRDVDKDRQHAQKKHRPIANGTVAADVSFVLAVFLLISALVISYYISISAMNIAIVYFVMNYFYSVQGKAIRFIDILLLSSFYILRIFYGAEICSVTLTGWFMATLTFAVLSLSLNKRYMECKNASHVQIPGRGYTKADEGFLQIFMVNFAIGAIVLLNIHAYFVLNIQSPILFVLINITAVGIILFYFDDSVDKSDDPVERVLKNKALLIFLVFFIFNYLYQLLIKIQK
jgi:4-hydroxybenzoate polyprenyltransferase